MKGSSRELLGEYEKRYEILKNVAKNICSEVEECLKGLPHIDRIYFRAKDPQSFFEKATDSRNKPAYAYPLTEIEDQVGGRIIVFFLSDLDAIKQKINARFTTVESSRRRPGKDEEFGYESHHFILIIPPTAKPKEWPDDGDFPKTFELQVRTIFMHAYAEPNHNLGYKSDSELSKDTRRELAWIAASAWGADNALERAYNKSKSSKK